MTVIYTLPFIVAQILREGSSTPTQVKQVCGLKFVTAHTAMRYSRLAQEIKFAKIWLNCACKIDVGANK